MNARGWLLASVLAGILPGVGSSQCPEPHYRWSEKIDASLANQVPQRVSLTTMLRSWAPRPLFRSQDDTCAERAGTHELKVYSVLGWVRHVDKTEDDKDWHIEITARANSPADSCVIVEIPLVDGDGHSGNYGGARSTLDALLAAAGASIDAHNDVHPPVKMRFIGPAFYDGFHHTHGGSGSSAHGGCNSSARALWEIHPVYWVRPPA
jgi:hypothetical protein